MNKFCLSVSAALLLAVTSPAYTLADEIRGGSSLGIGGGKGVISGDFIKNRKITAFQLGADVESDKVFLTAEGTGDTSGNNAISMMTLIAGGGYRYMKIGTGFITQRTSTDTAAMVPGSYIVTDTSRLTYYDVTTVPVYLRLRPVLTSRFTLALDAYYGLYTSGQMKVPVKVLGLDAEMHTVPQKAHGTHGFGAMFLWQFDGRALSGLKLEMRTGTGRMDRKLTTFHGDVFGVYSGVTVPEISLHNRFTVLSYVTVF